MLRNRTTKLVVLTAVVAGGLVPAWLTAGANPPPPSGSAVAQAGKCTMVGTDGVDVLIGTSGNDVICGRGGNDLIVGGGGQDVLVGGSGNDTFMTRDGVRDVVRGGPGDDLAVQRDVLDRTVGVERNNRQS